jgi:hypothetical protein
MKLIRPADPTQPIRISNATVTTLEEPPEAWWRDNIAFAIESTDVELEPDG